MVSNMSFPPSQFRPLVRDRSLALRLEKFSFAITKSGTASHQWVHDNRADELFLFLQETQEPQGESMTKNPLLMIVAAGNQELENQDLRKLQAMVEDFENQRPKPFTDHALDLPVHVMVKFPCIAVRYLRSPTIHRRIQMKFINEFDYHRVIDIFERLKFHIEHKTESKDGPTKLENLVKNQNRQSVTDQSLVSSIAKSSNLVGDASYTPHVPLLPKESPLFKRYHIASSDTTTSYHTARSRTARSFEDYRTLCTNSARLSGEPLMRSSSVLEDGKLLSAFGSETTAHPGLLHTSLSECDHTSQPDLSRYQDTSEASIINRAKTEAFRLLLPKSAPNSSNEVVLDFQHEHDPFRRARSAYEHSMIEGRDMNTTMNKRISLIPEFLRPVSAPVPSNLDNFRQWLPPRRELPFPKPRSPKKLCILPVTPLGLKLGSMTREISKNVSGCVASGNTIPAPTRTAKRTAQRQMIDTSMEIQGDATELVANGFPHGACTNDGPHMLEEREEEPSPLASKNAVITKPLKTPALQSEVATSATRKRRRETKSERVPVSKKVRMMLDKATQTQTWSGRDHTAPPSFSTNTVRSAYSTTDEVSQQADRLVNGVEDVISRLKSTTRPEELWHRPGYSEASPEERQLIINDFICENLDNEDFLKLCEDTENVWRRIGLES